MKTWRGSDWPGKARCGGSRNTTMTTVPRLPASKRWDWSIRASKAAPTSRAWSRRRRQIAPWPRDPDGAPLYPGDANDMSAPDRKRRIDAGEPYALRLDMQAALARAGKLTWAETGAGPNGETGAIAADPAMWGDVILARKETPTSYHLAVVVDDAAQGVTDVVRGRDLFHATARTPVAPGAARPAAAAVSPPPPRPRRRWPQALEINAIHRLARTTRARRIARPDPPSGRARLSAASVALSAPG